MNIVNPIANIKKIKYIPCGVPFYFVDSLKEFKNSNIYIKIYDVNNSLITTSDNKVAIINLINGRMYLANEDSLVLTFENSELIVKT